MGADTHDPYFFDKLKSYHMDNQIYYFHGKTQEGNRFTIAGKFDKDKTLIAAISLCSDSDQFDKKLGRVIASSRLESEKPDIRGRIRIPEILPVEENEGKQFSNWCSGYENLSNVALKSAFGLKIKTKYKNLKDNYSLV